MDDLRKLQLEELKILKMFRDICEENNLAPAGPSRGPAGKYGRFCRGAGLRPPGHRLCGGTQRFQPGGAARTA